MKSPLEEIIQQLSLFLNTPLHIDALGACTLLVDNKISVQIQLDKSEKHLLIGEVIGTIAPGKFREDVLRLALIANDNVERIATFGYQEKENKLILFHYFPLQTITEKLLQNYLATLIDLGLIWNDALESGSLPQSDKKSTNLSNPFGMK